MNAANFLKPKNEVAFLYDDFSLRQGLEKMSYHGYTSIPVLSRSGYYIGSISEGDFLWYIIKGENTEIRQVNIKEAEVYTVGDLVKKGKNPPVKITAPFDEIIEKAMDQNFIPVVDDRNFFIGIVTRRDIINYFRNNS